MLTKTQKTIEWSIFSFLGLVIIVCGSLFGYQVAYANKIYHNVFVAGMDMSGKSRSQAAAIINKQFNDVLSEEVILRANDKELTTKISDTGLALDVDKIVSLSYQAGRSDNFFEQLKNSAKTLKVKADIPIETQIDQEKYDNFLKIAVAQFNSDPVNASLAVDNGQIKEVAEQEGAVVVTDSLPEKILKLSNDNSEKIIGLDVKNTDPEIKVASFADAKSSAEGILAKKIQFSYENKTYTPSRIEIGNWIKFTNQNKTVIASLNDSNILAYLNKIASDFEIAKKDKKVNAADGSVIDPGQEGKALDKNNAISQIKSQIKGSGEIQIALQTVVVTPNEVKVYPAAGIVPGQFPGKYIDITLADQKLCTVEGNNVLNCYTVSSGKASMPTPKGTFYIQNKNPREWSHYGLWMPWWQAFNGPYGLHELPEWPNGTKEGQNHLGIPVSHGCVRLGIGDAKTLYDWTDIGTPVYIH